MLVTAETWYRPRGLMHLSPPERAVMRYWPAEIEKFWPEGIAGRPPVVVYANEGRWIAECPLENPVTGQACHGAQIASDTDPRFFCVDCLNMIVAGKWLRVVWPAGRAAIERALEARPQLANRNWQPGETTATLIAENIERGLGGGGD